MESFEVIIVTLLKGRYPLVLCYLSTSPELVDVNVHPAKTELRFQYTEEVQGLIAQVFVNAYVRKIGHVKLLWFQLSKMK